MGIYRLSLSVLIALFHFGGLSALSGRVIVFAFFVLSGYLMALVIERAYGARASGALRFYLNRALRLAPLFAVYCLLTVLLVNSRDGAGFLIDPLEPLFHTPSGAQELKFGFGVQLTELWPPLLAPSIGLIPQAWSLVIECCFYATAPLLAWLWRTGRGAGFLILMLGSVALNVGYISSPGFDLDAQVYQNFFAALWVFQAGMLLYYTRERTAWIAPVALPLGAVLALLFVVLMLRYNPEHIVEAFYLCVGLAIAVTLLLSQVKNWPRWFRGVDRRLGDLAYGIFLNHFIAAYVVLILGEEIFAASGAFNAFGRVNTAEFGYWTVILSITFAAATLIVVERPLERLRDLVRGVRFTGGGGGSPGSAHLVEVDGPASHGPPLAAEEAR